MTTPPLRPASVHLWHIPLSHGIVGADIGILGDAEQARAARFATDKLRNDYLNTHAAKRRILANYVDIAAKDLAFGANPYGKPCLAGASAALDIRFNLSHTQTTAVMAVAPEREIGVDVEALDRKLSVMPLAERYFSDQVLNHLKALAGANQRSAFLRYWTQFEAYKKAQGDGLRGGDGKLLFNLAEAPGDCFQPLPFATLPVSWQVVELDRLAGYAISVVVEASTEPLTLTWLEYPRRD